MTLTEVKNEYQIEHDRITSPGKFEGEPVFAPHFWDMGLQGFADSDDGQVYKFKITPKDREEWPQLDAWLGRKRTLSLREDDQGFVHCF